MIVPRKGFEFPTRTTEATKEFVFFHKGYGDNKGVFVFSREGH